MGILMHTHTVTTTDVSPDPGELPEILGDVSVQTIPLCYSWGCRTFQTASHIHIIQIWGVWATSTVVYTYSYTLTRVSQKSRWCKCANHATLQSLRLENLSNCISHSYHTYIRYLSTFNCWGWAYGCTLTPLPPQMFPRMEKVSQNPRWCKCTNNTI